MIRIEAESMSLSGYSVENNNNASGNQGIQTFGTGTATTSFTGTAGSYTVRLGYFDESDGISSLEVFIDGVSTGPIALDQELGSAGPTAQTFVEATIGTNITLNPGSTIEIRGIRQGGERARVDYIEFVPEGTPPANTAPVASDDTFNTTVDNAVNGNVLADNGNGADSDADGDSLVINTTPVTGPANGTVNLSADGSFSYTPDAGFTGSDSFEYEVSDGNGGLDTATVSISVNSGGSGSGTPIRIEAESMSLSGYSVENNNNASGNQGIQTFGTGTATTSFTGTAGSYTVRLGYFDESDGISSLEVFIDGVSTGPIALDQELGSAGPTAQTFVEATIGTNITLNPGSTIEIRGIRQGGERARVDYIEFVPEGTPPANTAPVASDDTFNTTVDNAVNGNVLADNGNGADSDADGDSLVINTTPVTGPANGTVNLSADGSFSYTPDAGFTGSDSFEYEVSDGNGGLDTATVSLVVSSTALQALKFEAESLTLNNFTIGTHFSASGNARITPQVGTSTAFFNFTGASGTYDVVLGYYDENDGVGTINVDIGGSVTTITLDQDLDSSGSNAQTLVSATIANQVTITSGTSIEIQSNVGGGDLARVDYIAFLPSDLVAPPLPGGPTIQGDTVDYQNSPRGSIVNLEQGLGFTSAYDEPIAIMPLGDSNTFGVTTSSNGDDNDDEQGGYRTPLWENFQELGLAVDFVGSLNTGPATLGDADHEGHSGADIDANGDPNNIADNIDDWLTNGQPDVVLLMIGTNDSRLDNLEQMVSELNILIDQIFIHSPDIRVLISAIPPVDPNLFDATRVQLVEDYNAAIPTIVNAKATQGKDITFVDAGLTVNDLTTSTMPGADNGLHLNASGYNKLADAWYETLLSSAGTQVTLANVSNIIGSEFDDVLVGDSSNNTIQGSGGNDRIMGLGGADTLTGGLGTDTFIYRSLDEGGDIITDFGADDILEISADGFGGGLLPGVSLTTNASSTGVFVSDANPVAIGNSGNFLYDTDSGILAFDLDGSGAAVAVEIANFSGLPPLNANQFVIV